MSLLAELQRRKVFKVGAAYLVIGWLLIQVATTVAPQLNIPDWAPRLITLVVLLGFPLALLLAWIIEATPEGVRIDRGTVGNKRIILICAILAAAAVGWYWKTRPAPSSADADLRSVAVLPFVNMSDDKGNEYFSDGVSEEILNVLASVPELHVAARTSSFSFKGEKKEVPEIARELKVRMVLDGSVRKQAERVRVTAQLIDASNGYHVWSQTFDRELKDIFAIQDEIARAIVQELKLKLNPNRSENMAGGTTDPATYDLYLKGVALWQARGEKNLFDALEAFRAALARDPNYAKAWAGVALVYAVLSSWSETVTDAESVTLAREAAEHAAALDPSLPEPWAAMANSAYSELHFDAARALFGRALALAPSYATAYQWQAESLATEGDVDAALASNRKAVALDPKSPIVRWSYAFDSFIAGHDEEALHICESILVDAPDWFGCPQLQFDAAVLRKDFAQARAALEKPAARRGPGAVAFLHAQMDALDGKGDVEAIAQQLLRLPDAMANPTSLTPLGTFDAMYWFMAIGRNDLAVERYLRAGREQIYIARQLAYDPHFAELHCDTRLIDLLRTLKVKEPHLAAPCPKGL
jgi:TolB-like protein/Tfp pilus assembly protein PilF